MKVLLQKEGERADREHADHRFPAGEVNEIGNLRGEHPNDPEQYDGQSDLHEVRHPEQPVDRPVAPLRKELGNEPYEQIGNTELHEHREVDERAREQHGVQSVIFDRERAQHQPGRGIGKQSALRARQNRKERVLNDPSLGLGRLR